MSLAVSGSLFAWAWGAFLLGPALVGRRSWALRHPAAALRVWAGLFATGVLGAVLGLALVLRSAVEVTREVGSGQRLTACQTCHAAAVYGASWLMTAAVATLLCVAGYRWANLAVHRHQVRRLTRGAAAELPGQVVDGVRVSLLTSETYAAAWTPGRHSQVVVTTALQALLSEDELRSVVAHESAHLRAAHRFLLGLAHVQGRFLAGLAPASEAERSVALLVELAADDLAARRCGPAVTAAALSKVADASDDDAMRLRARRTAAHSNRSASTAGDRVANRAGAAAAISTRSTVPIGTRNSHDHRATTGSPSPPAAA
jgi:Zn-dependent protease with chaperone function